MTSHINMKFIITELQLMCRRGTSSKHMLTDMNMSRGPKFTIKEQACPVPIDSSSYELWNLGVSMYVYGKLMGFQYMGSSFFSDN